MEIDAIIVGSVWLCAILTSILIILYIQTHKRRELDFSGWTLGIIIFDVFLTILSIASIIHLLQN